MEPLYKYQVGTKKNRFPSSERLSPYLKSVGVLDRRVSDSLFYRAFQVLEEVLPSLSKSWVYRTLERARGVKPKTRKW